MPLNGTLAGGEVGLKIDGMADAARMEEGTLLPGRTELNEESEGILERGAASLGRNPASY